MFPAFCFKHKIDKQQSQHDIITIVFRVAAHSHNSSDHNCADSAVDLS